MLTVFINFSDQDPRFPWMCSLHQLVNYIDRISDMGFSNNLAPICSFSNHPHELHGNVRLEHDIFFSRYLFIVLL